MKRKNGARRARGWMILLALAGAATLGGACQRAHLSPYYGNSYNAWFVSQHIRTEPAEGEPARRALSSLDAQEAGAISKNYRRTVGGQDTQGQGQMVMTGQPRIGNGEGYIPPPSVPGSQ
jgi:hypothetical protein